MTSAWLTRISPQIQGLWRGQWSAGTVEPPRYLFEHELVVASQGSCSVNLQGTTHELGAGSFIVVPPETLHVTTTGAAGVYRWCIHLDWAFVPAREPTPICRFHPELPQRDAVVAAPAFVPRMPLVGSFSQEGPVLAQLADLFRRWETEAPLLRATCRASLLELLTHLLWQEGEPATRTGDRSTQLAHLVKDLLDSKLHKPASTRTLLASLGFTYEHLARVFQAEFGIAPLAYMNAQRLERARALLEDPRLTIAEIAFATGFQDAGYFTRKFRTFYGQTPTDLRKLM